ncbi:protein ROOT INITIATION DEFECTIVE 3-like [Papaver somniferum]|uniref:protein ROOT INITIATION DEFECTIVE 3-like n=1 Tax=Papaver somniferum TaxID=3469 RepID=UPI000E705F9F|nr:protein ROOT INITIATION DEFECTIVE 3-like [Papaver somniferum]XP_026394580.1 protein ROOT INITIATION DEFECTIVE 3-like [Papaver somniferum]
MEISKTMEVVMASSKLDAGISCFDIETGAEQLRLKSCASPPHGLISLSERFFVSSQVRESSSSSSGSILHWSRDKPVADVKSFPAEPISPLVSNSDGTYIIGGGCSGNIYLWEVASGRLLKKWNAHYRGVTCLVLSDDESLLISGAEDGCVRVWSLLMIFDDIGRTAATHLYEHNFSEHTLKVTDIVTGHGGCNAIIISSSEDRTCKVWSLSKGKLLRTIDFPSAINAVALDPCEHIFYAGGKDGKMYVVSLTGENTSASKYGMHIVGALSDNSNTAVTCLAFSKSGVLLVSGWEDGRIRIWDTKSKQIVRMLQHSKGQVSNVIVVHRPLNSASQTSMATQSSASKRNASLLPPLDKYVTSTDDNDDFKTVTASQPPLSRVTDALYCSSDVMKSQIKELQQEGSTAASQLELDRLRVECKRSLQMSEQWKKMHGDLHQFCADELVDYGRNGCAK